MLVSASRVRARWILADLQHPLLRDVPEHHRHPQPPRHREAARVGVLLDAHHRDAQLPQPHQHPCADLAEAEQHDVPGQAARRPAQRGVGRGRCRAPPGPPRAARAGAAVRRTRRAVAGSAARRLAHRRVVDGEQVEQRQVRGPQRIGPGHAELRHRERDDARHQADEGPPQPPRQQRARTAPCRARPAAGARCTTRLQDDRAAPCGRRDRRLVRQQPRAAAPRSPRSRRCPPGRCWSRTAARG